MLFVQIGGRLQNNVQRVGGQPIRCPPTGAQLANNRVVQEALRQAWRSSQYGRSQAHEEGGWIYQNPDTGAITIRRAQRGQGAAIDLTNPQQIAGYNLIGNFHTHPHATAAGWDPNPSAPDLRNATRRNVPGVIMSDQGINPYGPNRAGSDPAHAVPTAQVTGYPGSGFDTRQNCP